MLACASSANAAPFRAASWHIPFFGNTHETFDYKAIAEVCQYFDLVAVQGVVEPQAIKTLRLKLNQTTGTRWGATIDVTKTKDGEPAGGYAFLWRVDRINFDGQESVYPNSKGIFAPAPFSVAFQDRQDGAAFVAATVRIDNHFSQANQEAQIKRLKMYWQWLDDQYGDMPIMLMGDFGQPMTSKAFDALTNVAVAVVRQTKTPSGKTSSANIWIDRNVLNYMPTAGIFDLAAILDMPKQQIKTNVSRRQPAFAIPNMSLQVNR